MRLDKYLKLTRLVKRRTIAKNISEAGKVVCNNRTLKPSSQIKVNDILEVYLGEHIIVVQVLDVDENNVRLKPSEAYKTIGKYTNAN